MNLYTNITSACLINGYITREFNIQRGVRQGYPMSMLVYVLFQEPLYRAIEKCNKIVPFIINNEPIKKLGYADDTTVFVKNDESFIELFNVINMFEKAGNAKINIRKTKLYGLGNWNKRINWPISELKIEMEYFCSLGITFSSNYNTAIHVTWKKIYDKIKIRFAMMLGRNLNIYQKAIIINSLISSKLWYTAHIYPFPIEYSEMINTEIFKFIWNNNSNPIKRKVLNKAKDKGGLGLLNIFHKANSIFLSTTIKLFLMSTDNSLIKYYMASKVNHIFGIRNDINVTVKICAFEQLFSVYIPSLHFCNK